MPARLPVFPVIQHLRGAIAGVVVAILTLSSGCAGHAARTADARAALDRGSPKEALACLNEQLGVSSEKELPPKLEPDQQLFVLDRSMVLQSLDRYELASRDLETADKGIEVLDFSRTTADDLGKYLFSDDAGPYQAPPYEKLMINTVNMMNYLARGDLSGARVEARRFAVMQKFIAEHEDQGKSMLGPGSYLAGFIFEKSGSPDEALLFYDEALQFSDYPSLHEPVCRLAARSATRSPRIQAILKSAGSQGATDDYGDLLVIVNYGRVPAKEAKRVPVGLALTLAADYISPDSVSTANRLAAQGLVTWVNYPTLGEIRGNWSQPSFTLDGRPQALEGMLAVDVAAKEEWETVQGAVVASAITRMITRLVAGEATRQVAGKGALGGLLSLGAQITMTAADTPDTRSWSTLPARIAFGRLRLPAGNYGVGLAASGAHKQQQVTLKPKGWTTVVLTSLH